MDIEIRNYKDSDWDELRNLINSDWEKNHPLTDKKLFYWQYKGYGKFAERKCFKLLFVDGKLEGFRGVIPGRYQFMLRGKRVIKSGVSYAVWLVTKKYRGQGMGYQLLQSIEKDSQICIATGSNLKTSVPIYRRNQYDYLDAFSRYVLPLDSQGYQKLLINDVPLEQIDNWCREISFPEKNTPIHPEPDELELLWDKSTSELDIFTLYRDKNFWRWRYIDSVGFRYKFFGNLNVGIVVGRIEKVVDDKRSIIDDIYVFRLIEIVPARKQTWEGEKDEQMQYLIMQTLAWAKENGCVAADFQCSSSEIHRELLYRCGFKKQDKNYHPLLCSLAGMFQPFRLTPEVNNAHWKVRNDKGELLHISAESTYFLKSDNDRDRPVLWPVQE